MQKLFVVVLALLAVSAFAEKRELEDVIKERLEQARDLLKERGADPAIINEPRVHIDHHGIVADAYFYGKVSGWLDFEILDLAFNRETLTLDYVVKFAHLSTNVDDYTFNGFFNGLLPLNGDGKLDLVLDNLVVTGTFKLAPVNGKVLLKFAEVSVKLPSVTNFQFRVTGWYSNELISNIISDVITKYFPIVAVSNPDLIALRLSQVLTIVLKDALIEV